MSASTPVLDFEELFAALPAPHAVLATDGTVLYINTALSNLLGTDRHIPGKPLAMLLAAAEAAKLGLAPISAWANALAAAGGSATPVVLGPAAGGEIQAGQCWQATLQSVPAHPVPRYVLLRLLDITLLHNEDELRIQAESIPQQVWTARADGTLDFYNQRTAAYLGQAMPVASQINWLQHLHPDDRSHAAERWQVALANRRYYEAEFRLRRYDGQYRWFLAQAQARHDTNGQLLRWYGTCTDIEDQKQSQRQLVAQNARLLRTNQDLDNFVYTASHDLKQPIHNMAGIFEELTRTADFRDPEAVKLVAMFEQALAHIHHTIDDLATVVREQRQAQGLAMEAVLLAPLAAEVINSLQDEVNRLGAAFELDFQDCGTVSFVRVSLQSLFYNLISNALRYAEPGRPPRIRLHCAPDKNNHPVLSVQDNGRGIDLQHYGSQLFRQFARFHPDVEGSGMGLYLVNRLVQQHGGRIEVESEVGKGTTFRVRFVS